MPNAEGRAARRAPRKSTASAAAPAAVEQKPERHVRSPLERAQGVYDKAKAASDKIAARLISAKAEVTALEAEADEAKVTLDWAASHPLLVKARKDAEDEAARDAAEAVVAQETPARDNTVEWDIDANRPMSETVAADAAATPTDAAAEEEGPTSGPETEGRMRTVEIADQPADVFEQGEPGEEEQPAPAAAPFPFDAPPAPNGTPFDFDAGRTTHVR